MSQVDERESMLQSQIDKLKKGKFRKTNEDMYEDIVKRAEKPIIYIEIDLLSPAPNDWNFFPEISDEKMLEMMFSIQENGLFNPIIVWERLGKYMILSGHNRVRAYKRIMNEYKGIPDFNEKRYETIPAIVYGENEIDEMKAKEIIIDTNYIQREEDKRLMPQIVKNRLIIVKNRKDIKGRTIDIVAEELGISSTKVYEDQLIANRIIPELNEMYFDNELKKKSLLRFAWFDKDIQTWIYNDFKKHLDNENVMKLKKGMGKNEIARCFALQNDIKKVTVAIRVPEELKDEFREMAKNWVKAKEKELEG